MLGFNIAQAGILASLPYLARLFSGFIFGTIGDALTKSEVMSVTAIRKSFCLFCKWTIVIVNDRKKCVYWYYFIIFSTHIAGFVFDWFGVCWSSSLLVCCCDNNIAWLQWCFNTHKFAKFTRLSAEFRWDSVRCDQFFGYNHWILDSHGRRSLFHQSKWTYWFQLKKKRRKQNEIQQNFVHKFNDFRILSKNGISYS